MAVREPSVAGTFYPADAHALKEFCEAHLQPTAHPIAAKAIILPHAGYVYSGQTACRVVSQVDVPKKNFLIGPNHHGIGAPFAIAQQGEWETPLGRVPIDLDLAKGLLEACSEIKDDEDAHLYEHSLEVEIPFLQTKNPWLEIVPLVVGTSSLPDAREVANACGRYLAAQSEPVLIVASSDMNHYEDDKMTRVKDRYALEAIENLDEDALAKAIKSHRISMCGFVPVFMLLTMKEFLGIQKATLVDYRTSSEASGDYGHVVGYAGFIFE